MGTHFHNLIYNWRVKRKFNARTGNLNGNNKTVEEDKEEKELGEELEHSFNSTDHACCIQPDNRTSVNDNKKDESKRCVAKLIQMMAEVCLEIDEQLLSKKHASIDNFEKRVKKM